MARFVIRYIILTGENGSYRSFSIERVFSALGRFNSIDIGSPLFGRNPDKSERIPL